MKEPKTEIYSDAVIIRSHNRRIVLRKHKRVRGGVTVEMYSVNNDRAIKNKHVLSSQRLGRNLTIFGLSFEALRDLSLAIELYHVHVEPIQEETFFYKPITKP